MAGSNAARMIAPGARQPSNPRPVTVRRPFIATAAPLGPPAQTHGHINLDPALVDTRLVDALGVDFVIQNSVLPVNRAGALTVVAAANPLAAEVKRSEVERVLGPIVLAKAELETVDSTITQLRQGVLAKRAEQRTPSILSSRHLGKLSQSKPALCALAGLLVWAVVAPISLATTLIVWASLCLLVSTCLRLAATCAAGRQEPPSATPLPDTLPTISLLVPLFRERDIASKLIKRLSELDYPEDKFEICLIVEKHDSITRATVADVTLPANMRVIVVPPGQLQTKPRAMNYALDFARGDIVGVYDAEDRPAPDQLKIVAAEFAAAPPEVACLQGRLDFYNPRTNWLSRCFTIDYAIWFRTILPGLERLGLPVPLGGTTLFFRRDILEKLGAWDAHNVTEDADLGVRLSRHGWRTKLIDTTTDEEANCRAWPWIKQRSRWIKGYMVTWAVHMRRPRRLWSDLGAWRFFGFQIIFLGSISQFVLAPLLWSFWLVLFGLPHPVADAMPVWTVWLLASMFFISEISNIAIGAWSCRQEKHRWLTLWVPTMHFYFPLAALASWKGLVELLNQPFYWDKTEHGIDQEQLNVST